MTDDVDPRIAATGGRRRTPGDPKSGYTWAGMADWGDWRQTRAHRHTRAYGCAKCGATFHTPNAVYVHLAVAHPRARAGRGGLRGNSARLRPSQGQGKGIGRVGDRGREIAA